MSRWPRFCFVVATCLVVPGLARAAPASAPAKVTGAEELWSGPYEGAVDFFGEPHVLAKTDHVPGRVGTRFGLYFKLLTEPAQAQGVVTMQVQTLYPDPGRLDPRTGAMVHDFTGATDCILGQPCLAGYSVDGADEVIPGHWRMIVTYNSKQLLDRTFVMETSTPEASGSTGGVR